MCKSESTGLGTLLRKIMDPNSQSEPLDKPMSLTASKRPRNKRKLNQANPPAKPSYNPPMTGENSSNKENDTVSENEPVHKRRRIRMNASTQNKYISPKQAPKQIKKPVSNNETKTGHRRSPRMPRATAKYRESIKAELRNPNKDE